MAKEVTFVRLDPQVKRTLERWAKTDGRSLSSLINKLITDWLKEQRAPRR